MLAIGLPASRPGMLAVRHPEQDALHHAGAKLQERSSGESFNFDIARFAKIAEESRARAEQEAEAAPGSPSAKRQPIKPARDWNAQVGSSLEQTVQGVCGVGLLPSGRMPAAPVNSGTNSGLQRLPCPGMSRERRHARLS